MRNQSKKTKRTEFVEQMFAGSMLGNMPRTAAYFTGAPEGERNERTIRVHQVREGDTIRLDAQVLKVVMVSECTYFADRVHLSFGGWGEDIKKDVLVTLVAR